MAQKSLPNLNKINTSMIWYSTFYNKHYKWLSSQFLYFLYFFNKLTVYLELFFADLFWINFEKTTLGYAGRKFTVLVKNETRFFKPVTAYLINLRVSNIVINVYYKTNLQRFKSLSTDADQRYIGEDIRAEKLSNKLFFMKKR